MVGNDVSCCRGVESLSATAISSGDATVGGEGKMLLEVANGDSAAVVELVSAVSESGSGTRGRFQSMSEYDLPCRFIRLPVDKLLSTPPRGSATSGCANPDCGD